MLRGTGAYGRAKLPSYVREVKHDISICNRIVRTTYSTTYIYTDSSMDIVQVDTVMRVRHFGLKKGARCT